MYQPEHFKEHDTAVLHRLIQETGMGVLIMADEAGIEANHIPFYLDTGAGNAMGVLQCHVARANPVWQRLEKSKRVLVVFQGPDAYVSPSWYASKAETGRVVPTWNYLAVHVEGEARIVQDEAWLRHQLHHMTDQQEAGQKEPWSVSDAPEDFTDRMIQAIVGIEIVIDRISGKRKASQNQSQANRSGVRNGLEAGNSAMAKWIP